MKFYKVTARVVELNAGLLELSPEQARRRRHAVVPYNGHKDVFEIVKPVQFKQGEVFGFEGEVNRLLAQDLGDPNAPPPAVPAADIDADLLAAMDFDELKEKHPKLVEHIVAGAADQFAAMDFDELKEKHPAFVISMVEEVLNQLSTFGIQVDPAIQGRLITSDQETDEPGGESTNAGRRKRKGS